MKSEKKRLPKGSPQKTESRQNAYQESRTIEFSSLSSVQEKLFGIIEHISDGFFFCDRQWRCLYINESALKILRRRREETLGKKGWELCPRTMDLKFHPEFHRALETNEPVHFEEFYPDPLEKWIECHAYPSPNGLAVHFQDITKRKEAEEELRQSERRFRLVAEATGALVYDLDFKTGRLDITHGVNNIIDFEIPDYPSFQWWISLIHPDDLFRLFEELKKSQEAGDRVGKYIYRVRNKEGEYRTVQDTVHVLWEEKEIVGHIGGVIDITERVRFEEALRESEEKAQIRADESERRKRQLEEANKELESFSYSISHDLRAPLRAIDGFTGMILREYGAGMEEEFKRKFNVVRENVKSMNLLIDDLLNLSRFGRQALSPQSLDMEWLFRNTWDELRQSSPESEDAELILNRMSNVKGDASLIRQVIRNLLSNALKYGKQGIPLKIEVGCCPSDHSVVFYVRDNGIGFDMRFKDKLFGIFQRLHSAAEFEGTGVGLAIVKRIIQKHFGKVWAEGKVGEGATFYFSLPKA